MRDIEIYSIFMLLSWALFLYMISQSLLINVFCLCIFLFKSPLIWVKASSHRALLNENALTASTFYWFLRCQAHKTTRYAFFQATCTALIVQVLELLGSERVELHFLILIWGLVSEKIIFLIVFKLGSFSIIFGNILLRRRRSNLVMVMVWAHWMLALALLLKLFRQTPPKPSRWSLCHIIFLVRGCRRSRKTISLLLS